MHDLVAHVVGVAADVVNGNMAGAPSDVWTAAQVDARRDRSIGELLAEWDGLMPALEPAITGISVADVTSHEHDVRTALGRPGDRDSDAVNWCVSWLVPRLDGQIRERGLPALRLELGDEEQVLGDGAPVMSFTGTPFTFFRASFGRRSRSQIDAAFAGGDPGPYVERMVIFGPSVADIAE